MPSSYVGRAGMVVLSGTTCNTSILTWNLVWVVPCRAVVTPFPPACFVLLRVGLPYFGFMASVCNSVLYT